MNWLKKIIGGESDAPPVDNVSLTVSNAIDDLIAESQQLGREIDERRERRREINRIVARLEADRIGRLPPPAAVISPKE